MHMLKANINNVQLQVLRLAFGRAWRRAHEACTGIVGVFAQMTGQSRKVDDTSQYVHVSKTAVPHPWEGTKPRQWRGALSMLLEALSPISLKP